jgi:hypothetical protein
MPLTPRATHPVSLPVGDRDWKFAALFYLSANFMQRVVPQVQVCSYFGHCEIASNPIFYGFGIPVQERSGGTQKVSVAERFFQNPLNVLTELFDRLDL